MNDLSKYSDDLIIEIISSNAEEELKKRGYAYGWYQKEPFVGAIYILVNPAFPNLVKIGYADDVLSRMNSLNRSSGIPDPYHCYALYKVKSRLEDLKLHDLIDTLNPALRHSKNREFYEIDANTAYQILSAIAQINGDSDQLVYNPFSDDYFVDEPPKNEDCISKSVRKNLTFESIGVPVGSTLVFTKDSSITCITADRINRVYFKDELYSISALAAKLLGTVSAQGGKYFLFNGETLSDIRNKLNV